MTFIPKTGGAADTASSAGAAVQMGGAGGVDVQHIGGVIAISADDGAAPQVRRACAGTISC